MVLQGTIQSEGTYHALQNSGTEFLKRLTTQDEDNDEESTTTLLYKRHSSIQVGNNDNDDYDEDERCSAPFVTAPLQPLQPAPSSSLIQARSSSLFPAAEGLNSYIEFDIKRSVKSMASSVEEFKTMEEPPEVAEMRSTGTVSGKVYKSYLTAGGNCCALMFLLVLCVLTQLLASGGDYWITYWYVAKCGIIDVVQSFLNDYFEGLCAARDYSSSEIPEQRHLFVTCYLSNRASERDDKFTSWQLGCDRPHRTVLVRYLNRGIYSSLATSATERVREMISSLHGSLGVPQ
ncbi:hypothetical protein J6590_014664 [Homalodisca vitripennis]|nr:hypothetical protein J6590_014664 [Homalodisca vitripennis]